MGNESLFCELSAQITERDNSVEQGGIISALRFFESEKGKQCSLSQREILKINISEAMKRERNILKQLSLFFEKDDKKGSISFQLTIEKKRQIVSIMDDVIFLYKLRNIHLPDASKQISILTDLKSDNPTDILHIDYNKRNNGDFYIESIRIQKTGEQKIEKTFGSDSN